MDIQDIKEKYGVSQSDAPDAIENLKGLVEKAKRKLNAVKKNPSLQGRNELTSLMPALVSARSSANSAFNALSKEAYNLTGEIDSFASKFKK